jgi:hypothetical protein
MVMNERIRELSEQAGITTNIDTDYFEKDMNKWVDYYSQKFAELLIRECADIAEVHFYQAHDMGWNIAEIIKEHFGVE